MVDEHASSSVNPTQQPLWQNRRLILLPRSVMIHDDTIIIAVQGSRKQTKQTSSKNPVQCPKARVSSSVAMWLQDEGFCKGSFVPVDNIWLGYTDITEACDVRQPIEGGFKNTHAI